ncbi:hypothetical protein K461DRAFT_293731 [Myriangium duriaei CBS 260.36]|uniref:Uncharacterized protein n=1 Tax=Myriangium duriaei CBS 260.36 TaxID=1168546 RepID=A0A9P4J1L3_9PEZI|nr:hypothetical protein K461DRAFT_293731 [Myriangium duriaei CBS 260.36]
MRRAALALLALAELVASRGYDWDGAPGYVEPGDYDYWYQQTYSSGNLKSVAYLMGDDFSGQIAPSNPHTCIIGTTTYNNGSLAQQRVCFRNAIQDTASVAISFVAPHGNNWARTNIIGGANHQYWAYEAEDWGQGGSCSTSGPKTYNISDGICPANQGTFINDRTYNFGHDNVTVKATCKSGCGVTLSSNGADMTNINNILASISGDLFALNSTWTFFSIYRNDAPTNTVYARCHVTINAGQYAKSADLCADQIPGHGNCGTDASCGMDPNSTPNFPARRKKRAVLAAPTRRLRTTPTAGSRVAGPQD